MMSRFSSASQLADFNRAKDKAKKMILNEGRGRASPVFLPKDGDGKMTSIVERDEEIASDIPPNYVNSELTIKNLA